MEPQSKNSQKTKWQDAAALQKRNDLLTKIALWGGLVVFLAASIWALTAASSNNSNSTTTAGLTAPKATSKDFQTGPLNAKVTLTEYADFECPACKAYYPVVKQLMSDFKGKVNFVYRYFPLETIHPNAKLSAQAGYAASLQGKFWQMHDKLFDTQDSWATLPDPTNTFVGYAKDLGLNTAQFQKDMTAQSTADFVQNAYNADVNMGLNATPTFFLNGKQITSPQSYQAFKDLLSKAVTGN